jgi:hypothetical protein
MQNLHGMKNWKSLTQWMAENQVKVEMIYKGTVLKIKFKKSSMGHKQTKYI